MPCLQEIMCSACKECYESSTTPFVSAPSSPKKSSPLIGYYTSATLTIPSPLQAHHIVDDDAASAYTEAESTLPSSPSLSEFEFNSRFSEENAWFSPGNVALPMSTAEELFHNGKIRPLNTKMCPSSCCISFMHQIDHIGEHFYDTCHSYACREDPASSYTEHHRQHLLRRKQRLGHTKPTTALSALEQWKERMGKYDPEHLTRNANAHHVERVMNIPSLPFAGYRSGYHRRARSLSPLRVFHMNEYMMMQGRASFERENMHTKTKLPHAVHASTITRPRRSSKKSWTLKELLNMGDSRVHDKRPQLQGSFSYADQLSPLQSYAGNRVHANGVESEKFGTKEIDGSVKGATGLDEEARSPWNKQKDVEEHTRDPCYSLGSQRAQVEEEMKKRTFLRYKRGLLGCLGFDTSKLSSFKGLHAMRK